MFHCKLNDQQWVHRPLLHLNLKQSTVVFGHLAVNPLVSAHQQMLWQTTVIYNVLRNICRFRIRPHTAQGQSSSYTGVSDFEPVWQNSRARRADLTIFVHINIFTPTHFNFSSLRSFSSCSACFLLRDRKTNKTAPLIIVIQKSLSKIQCIYRVHKLTLFFQSIQNTATGGHYLQEADSVPTSALRSSVAFRSSFCLSLLYPSVPLKFFLFQGGVSPLLLVSSPLLSSLPLHADTHNRK